MPKKIPKFTVENGACFFCGSKENNVDKYGLLVEKGSLTAHHFCMLFSSGLCQQGKDSEGLLGFLPKDIKVELTRGRRLRCAFCSKTGATIGCVSDKCKKVFHLNCGMANGVLNQYFDTFSSFCVDHRPRQKTTTSDRLSFHGTASTICPICMSAVESRASINVLRMPCCRNSWMHRECIQRYAISAGVHFMKCPLCNDVERFRKEMLEFGIYIPEQDAAWEVEPGAFTDQLERPSTCSAPQCLCSMGRTYNRRDSSEWELMSCDWCGSQATHLKCSNLLTMLDDWLCKECISIKMKEKHGNGVQDNDQPIVLSSPMRKRNIATGISIAESPSREVGTSEQFTTPCKQRRLLSWRHEETNVSSACMQSDSAVPVWFKQLMKEDIVTGANLGRKFAKQFKAHSSECRMESPTKMKVSSTTSVGIELTNSNRTEVTKINKGYASCNSVTVIDSDSDFSEIISSACNKTAGSYLEKHIQEEHSENGSSNNQSEITAVSKGDKEINKKKKSKKSKHKSIHKEKNRLAQSNENNIPKLAKSVNSVENSAPRLERKLQKVSKQSRNALSVVAEGSKVNGANLTYDDKVQSKSMLNNCSTSKTAYSTLQCLSWADHPIMKHRTQNSHTKSK